MKLSDREIYEGLIEAVLNYNVEDATRLAEESVRKNIDPVKAIQEGPVKGVMKLGERFGAQEIFLPGLILGAEACIAAVNIFKAKIRADNKNVKPLGKVVMGTVEGDIHDVGKNLVSTILEARGFEVYDLGEDVPSEAFIVKAKEVDADIVGASALTTVTRERQGELVKALKKSGLRAKCMVGGAVVDASWTERIGADGYANNLVEVVDLAKRLVGAL